MLRHGPFRRLDYRYTNNQNSPSTFASVGAEQGIVTLATGTDPRTARLRPVRQPRWPTFTFQASSGTDTVSAITVLLGTGTAVGVSLVEITDSTGATVCSSTANPSVTRRPST